MKILLINGSPKGGGSNSLRLSQAFLKGFRSAVPEAEVERVDLCDKTIQPCRGCFCCWNKTPGRCVIDDDMAEILEKRIQADLVVWSFPLYFFNVPGPLKNFIDRQLPMVLPFMEDRADGVGSGSHPARYDLGNQKNVIVSTCGFYSAEKNYDSVCSMFDHFCGKGRYETIFCGQGELFRVKELSERTGEYLALCRKAGQEYAGGGITPETKAQLSQLLFPKETFEAMADASWGVDRKTGEKEPEALSFTRQMAALYNKNSYDGKERVLEMHYTDLDETYQILLEKDGSRVCSGQEKPYTTRVETPFSVWQQIAAGEIRGDAALMEGKYRVKGDFDMMLKWDRYFGASAAQTGAPVKNKGGKKPPKLLFLLLCWTALFTGISVDPHRGAFAALAFIALLSVLTIRHERTVYDTLTSAVTAVLCGLALFTGKGELTVFIGYLIFGLLWLGSCFTKEPLCAAYVKYGYGGDDALQNPIFMKTNRILAAGWGILFVLAGIAKPLLQRDGRADLGQIILYVLMALMGIFTAWFQKWYPAHVAAGKNKTDKAKILTIIGIAAMILLTAIKAATSSQLAANALIIVGLAFFFVVEAVAKTPDAESGLRFKTFFADLKKPGVILLILILLALMPVEMLLSKLLVGSAYVDHVLGRTNLATMSLSTLLIDQIFVVLGEEIAFRGFFLGKGMKQFPFWPVAILSAVVFSAAHFAAGEAVIVAWDLGWIFIDALLFALLYRKTNNCLISCIPHFLNNVLGLFLVPILFG